METSDDAGVYRLGADIALVQTVDFFPPLVDDPFVFGQIAAANALSDVYAMNGRPLTALNLVGFPDQELGLEVLSEILRGGWEKVAEAGAVVVGGHSVRDAEVKYGLSVTGLVHPAEIMTNAGARPGDLLVLTKPLGTGIVTTAAKRELCPEPILQAAIAGMTQLNVLGRDAFRAAGGVHAVTDITGFGLAGHAAEMARASRCTLEIHLRELPAIEGVASLDLPRFRTRGTGNNREFLAEELGSAAGADELGMELAFDPQTSGGLLIAIEPDRAPVLLEELRSRRAAAAALVGRVLAWEHGPVLRLI